jgi:hypothetical protein
MPSFADVLHRLSRTGLRRGFFEGSRGWMYVGVAATTVRVLHRLLAEQETVERVELRPGDAIEIRSVPPER